MIALLVFGAVFAALFTVAYISKRRFGLLGLALTAGATLSTIWDQNTELIVSMTGLIPAGPITEAVTLSILVLLPAVLLLFHGYTYKSKHARIIGSLLFAAFALVLLVVPIGHTVPLDGASADLYTWVLAHDELLISVGIILAVVDLFFTKPAGFGDKDKKR